MTPADPTRAELAAFADRLNARTAPPVPCPRCVSLAARAEPTETDMDAAQADVATYDTISDLNVYLAVRAQTTADSLPDALGAVGKGVTGTLTYLTRKLVAAVRAADERRGQIIAAAEHHEPVGGTR